MLTFKFQPDELLFCSDLHIGHDREFLWGPRGFKNAEEHDKFLWDALENLQHEKIVLVNLGDCCLTSQQSENFHRLARYPFKQHLLVWGNHNAGAKNAYHARLLGEFPERSVEVYPVKHENVCFVGDCFLLRVEGGGSAYCSHYAPMIWDRMSRGRPAICGHSHGNLVGANPSDCGIGKILDVGVENAMKVNGTPFLSWSEVGEIVARKLRKTRDHHDGSE